MERFVWNILAAAVLAMPVASLAETPKQPPLTISEISTLIRNSPPMEIRATRTFSTNVPVAEIERRWQEVANKPDHPERRSIERLRELSRAKETSEVVMAFGVGRWHYGERKSESDNFVASGDTTRRWMLSETEFEPGKRRGHLTIVHVGVPFPLSANVGMFRDVVLVQRMAAVCNWNIASNSLEPEEFAGIRAGYSYRDPGNERFLINRDSTGRAVDVACVSESVPGETYWKSECRFGASAEGTSWLMPIATSVKVVASSGLIETVTNVRVRALSEAELQRMTDLPMPDSATTRTVSNDSPGKHSGPTGVWESTSTGDKITLMSLAESGDLAANERGSSGWGRWLSLAVISVVVTAVAVLWLRRKS